MSAQGLMLGTAGSGVYSHTTALTNLNAGSGDPETAVLGYLDREDGLIDPTYFTLSSTPGVFSRYIYSAYWRSYTTTLSFGCSGYTYLGDTLINGGWSTMTIVSATQGVTIVERTSAFFFNGGYEAQWTWAMPTNPFGAPGTLSQIRFN